MRCQPHLYIIRHGSHDQFKHVVDVIEVLVLVVILCTVLLITLYICLQD